MTYKELLSQDPTKLQSENVNFQVQDTHHQLKGDILETEKSIAELKHQLNAAKSAPASSRWSLNIVDIMARINGREKGLQILLDLQAELFPTEV